jgi:hypothetical protein
VAEKRSQPIPQPCNPGGISFKGADRRPAKRHLSCENPAKILALMKENKIYGGDSKGRKGMFTSGILSKVGGHQNSGGEKSACPLPALFSKNF